MNALVSHLSARSLWTLLVITGLALACGSAVAASLDSVAIGKAAGIKATTQKDGVVKIGWSRSDVPVTVDGMRLPPAAGLGSWAAFAPMGNHAMVMGDTVVLQDEVDAAMDAALNAKRGQVKLLQRRVWVVCQRSTSRTNTIRPEGLLLDAFASGVARGASCRWVRFATPPRTRVRLGAN